MFVTLFGIMLITFSVTRLAPGDPAALKLQKAGPTMSGDQQLSKKLIEQTRQLYGFDRPLLLNLRSENVRTYSHKLADDLIDSDEYTRSDARDELRSLGIIALPYLIELLEDDRRNAIHSAVCDIFADIASIQYAPELSLADRIELCKAFTAKHNMFFDTVYQQSLIDQVLTGNLQVAQQARESLISAGSASLPAILTAALQKGADGGMDLFSTAAVIARKSWHIEKDHSPETKAEMYNSWKKWWSRNRHKYTFFSPMEQFARIFTATQFGQWMGMVLTFDFGQSYSHHVPVIKLIKERLPISMQLSLISIFLTYVIAIPLGVFSATHQYKTSDKVITVILFILYSLPSFWVANMLILFTTGGEFPHIFPNRYLHSPGAETFPFFKWFIDWLWHLVLPITCLTYGSFAYISRQMRVGMLDIIRQDFIRTARAKGLSERAVIFKHALRNALIPIVTLLAFLLPALLGGSVIIEEIFTIPGMGKLSFDAILNRDYPIINAIAFFSAFLTLLGMLLTDIAYVFVDPRISFDHDS
jgi:peptide/nickel transport system permease protein